MKIVKITINRLLPFAMILLLSLSNCVENRIHIDILPDGNLNYKYFGKGNKEDLYDADFPLPGGNRWKIHEYTEKSKDQVIYHYDAYTKFKPSDELPENFYTGTEYPQWVFLSHPLSYEYNNYFFFTKYKIVQLFKSRNISEKYPGFKQLLDEKNKSNEWAYDILAYLFSASLDSVLKTYTGEKLPEVAIIESSREEVNNLILDKIENLKGEITPDNWKTITNEGRKKLFASLGIEEDEALATNFDKHFRNLEQEARINTLLRDDIFRFSVTLPGRPMNVRSESVKGDTLSWEFDLKDFMDKDYVIKAESLQIHWKRVVVLGAIFLFILIFAGTRIFRSV